MSTTTVRLDPLEPCLRGEWTHDDVTVRRVADYPLPEHPVQPGLSDSVRTPHFQVFRDLRGLTIVHSLTVASLSDELATIVADELDAPGYIDGEREFQLVLVGLIRSTVPGAIESWRYFYRRSIERLEDGSASFAAVHEHAEALIVGRELLDLGSCFGFFPLRIAAGDIDIAVTASDLIGDTMRLLDRVAGDLGRPLRTLTCDAREVPLSSRSADTVTAIHLLEHLDRTAAIEVLDEAIRLARRRVVVAVPFEGQPRECFGHIQAFDLDSLYHLGCAVASLHSGVSVEVHEHHGGWLVFDRSC
ncbi:class I SAM-dependent methyltransferase [Antrihabitans sp. YC3-6]|uniref:Class I SAM-dependent methyltransferase n=1 Tax=Antrihabitans stalagmiti TaxID=2799499 RepID=A0A934NPI7_9NOCA|nr:mycofactocin oligosaccharide methyltransferase MftM [Antrihabitans stalagmiti]MBJ8338993.1 class I SAM-dependent methyltransferase [Antrihabitans stalagmiti]